MNKILKKLLRKTPGLSLASRISTSLSDNQIYPQVWLDAANDYRLFNQFRQHPIYNQILEHVTENEGEAYLKLIAHDGSFIDLKSNVQDARQSVGPVVIPATSQPDCYQVSSLMMPF